MNVSKYKVLKSRSLRVAGFIVSTYRSLCTKLSLFPMHHYLLVAQRPTGKYL